MTTLIDNNRVFESRRMSLELRQLSYLMSRGALSKQGVNKQKMLMLGYRGEVQFDGLIEGGDFNIVHLKDFQFTEGEMDKKSVCQIDNLMISGDRIVNLEIKNYNFDLRFCGDAEPWAFKNGEPFKDLVTQVSKQTDALRFMSKKFRGLEVISYLVFINPNQTIYNLPSNRNILTTNNLMGRLRDILRPNTYDTSDFEKFLSTRRVTDDVYRYDITTPLAELRPGIVCDSCFSFLEKYSRTHFICEGCQRKFTFLDAVHLLIKELTDLYPDLKLTSRVLSEFSGKMVSDSSIRCLKHRLKKDIY